jgi:thiamine-phosphate pyrophosphorylase
MICDLYDVILIINENVLIAKEINAQGVHLGRADMYISEARSILGEDAIIGGVANNIKDVERLIEQKADYIGLGPFAVTEGVNSLNPVLGIDGYDEILGELKMVYSLDETPIIASGGIDIHDVDSALSLGIYWVSVSGLLTNYFSSVAGLLKTIERKTFKLEVLNEY